MMIGGKDVHISIGGKRIRVFCRCDSWEWNVIFLSVLTFSRGLAYILNPQGQASLILDRIGTVFPLPVLGALWITSALWTVGSVWLHRRARRALLMQCALFLFWGTFYALSGNVYAGLLFLALAGWAGTLPRLMAMPKLVKDERRRR